MIAPVAVAVLFAISYVTARVASRELTPLATTLLRYVPALCFLGTIALARQRSALRLPRSAVPALAFLGLTGMVGYHYFFFAALQHTSTLNTAIINALSPVITALLARLFLGERLPRAGYAGIAISLAGVVLLLSRGDLGNLRALDLNRGDLLMILSVLSWAAYALGVKRLSPRFSSLTLSFWSMVFGVAFLAPVTLLEGSLFRLGALSMRTFLAILYMGLGASGAGYLLYNASIARLGPTRTASVVYSLVPLFVAVLSALLLDEPMTTIAALSTLLILGGLHLTL